jgi:hypothetical protein
MFTRGRAASARRAEEALRAVTTGEALGGGRPERIAEDEEAEASSQSSHGTHRDSDTEDEYEDASEVEFRPAAPTGGDGRLPHIAFDGESASKPEEYTTVDEVDGSGRGATRGDRSTVPRRRQ